MRLHRNNRLYGLLLQVCRLVFESTLPAETPGRFSFVDFRRDERKMARLFEVFVRNFYQREQSRFRVKREVIKWQFTAAQDADLFFLPQMETDITLENDTQKIIIDAKFYRETLVSRYEREKLRSAHLYQLFAYLNNQRHADRPHSQSATGILLYPTVQQEVDLNYLFQEHPVLIRTLNLNAPWQQIAERLQAIIQ